MVRPDEPEVGFGFSLLGRFGRRRFLRLSGLNGFSEFRNDDGHSWYDVVSVLNLRVSCQ
ncbi:hypothetical protein URH17368_1036 [Alicyclobacillus hesperidum URH17-3-68]|nr:hypothetical protein URH17368_1036 [Alicyclobacillus hesperidum URH17-3-68]